MKCNINTLFYMLMVLSLHVHVRAMYIASQFSTVFSPEV